MPADVTHHNLVGEVATGVEATTMIHLRPMIHMAIDHNKPLSIKESQVLKIRLVLVQAEDQTGGDKQVTDGGLVPGRQD